MPAIHREIFRVRYSECNALGQLTNVNYLRWMQESAFAASRAVGYDFAHYDAIGHLWLVHETDIEYLNPLEYGDEVEVKTWVMDFRRFRSKRAYEFTHIQSGKLSARASTDWVYVSSKTFQPARIPEDMRLAFFPEGVPEEAGPRERFPSSIPLPSQVFSIHRRAEWSHMDTMWHVTNAMYLTLIEDAGVQVCDTQGLSLQRMMQEGFRINICGYRIKYLQQARIGDELRIATWHSDLQPDSLVRHYTITREADGELLVQALALWKWVDLKTGKFIPIPEHCLTRLTQDLALGS